MCTDICMAKSLKKKQQKIIIKNRIACIILISKKISKQYISGVSVFRPSIQVNHKLTELQIVILK